MRSLWRLSCAVLILFCAFRSLALDPLATWHQRSSGVTYHLNDVAYGAGKFLAVGTDQGMLRSSNGVEWVPVSASGGAFNSILWSVTYGNGNFVATGEGGFARVSQDGLNWAYFPLTNILSSYRVRWVKDRFFALGTSGRLASSTDGTNWPIQTLGAAFPLAQGVAYGDGKYVILGGAPGLDTSKSFYSTNGTDWLIGGTNLPLATDLHFHLGRFVAPVSAGRVLVSSNGSDWVLTNGMTYPNDNFAITHVHDRFVMIGHLRPGLSAQLTATSMDGYDWKTQSLSSNNFAAMRGITTGNNSMVAVGQNGTIFQSDPLFHLRPGSTITGGALEWILHGEAGFNYRIQSANNLNAVVWTDVTNILSTNDTMIFIDPAPSPTNRFYRVVTP